ncbi:MucBP domain-containing protein [Weissella cibaria]|uniref:MucBP domain-containing protein n=1 Tax=Weissella cibaria TaxID=137591 RepID=UPI000BFF7E40|nr:MucBP domain-containing protein [Weissella cibaria]
MKLMNEWPMGQMPKLRRKEPVVMLGVTMVVLGMMPVVRAAEQDKITMISSPNVATHDPKNWDWSTDNLVAQTVVTTVSGAVNAAGTVLPAGTSFVQEADARITNGFAVGLTIDNANGQYQAGDTITIPLYGEMISDNAVNRQRYDLVRARGELQHDQQIIGTYEVVGQALRLTLQTTPIGRVASHLTIAGSTAAPLPEAPIWAAKTGSARIVFGQTEAVGHFAFTSRFQTDAPGVATQHIFTKSDQMGVGSYYQDDGYMNALLRGDATKAAQIRENGQFATSDLVQIQQVKIASGTVLSVNSSSGYSTYYVVDKNKNGHYQATVISATTRQMNTEPTYAQTFVAVDAAASDAMIAHELARNGRGAYTTRLNDDGSYTLAYNMGNPYTEWGIENFHDGSFSTFLQQHQATGALTLADLQQLDANISRAGGDHPSEGTGSHGHQFYLRFADNTTVNAAVSILKTYDGNGDLLAVAAPVYAQTTPDVVDINGQARLKVFHVDEFGHEVAPTETTIANSGTAYATTAKSLPAYQMVRVTDNAHGHYGKANETIAGDDDGDGDRTEHGIPLDDDVTMTPAVEIDSEDKQPKIIGPVETPMSDMPVEQVPRRQVTPPSVRVTPPKQEVGKRQLVKKSQPVSRLAVPAKSIPREVISRPAKLVVQDAHRPNNLVNQQPNSSPKSEAPLPEMVAQAPTPELPATDFTATPWLTLAGLGLLTTVATVGVIRQKKE